MSTLAAHGWGLARSARLGCGQPWAATRYPVLRTRSARGARRPMRHVLALLATALPAAPALAQATVVIPTGLAAAAGNSSNAFPWGTSAATFPGLRVQTLYDSSNFTAAGISAPIRILRLKWRANDAATSWTGGTFAQATIRLATAAVDHAAVTPSFAANVGADLTTVYSGTVAFLPGTGAGIGLPGTIAVDVALTTPFVYDPALGDLAIDVDCPGGANFAGGTLVPMDVQTGAAASRVYASTNYPASNGITTGHGAVVEVVHVPVNSLLAAFTTDVSGGATPVTVHFTDRSYTNVAAGPTSWAWDFENDGVVDSTQRNPTHVYPACGRYSVSLRVTDGVHAPSTTVRTDCIVTDAITADFTTQFLGPNTVSFTDTSTPPATARSWDLDGDHVVDAFGASVVHVYPAGSGPVAVTLTTSRLCGAPASRTRSVLPTPGVVTTFAGGNGLGGSGAGNVFDLEVLNPCGINVTAVTICPLSPTAALGAPIGCDVWLTTAPGGVALTHADATLWRHVATGSGLFAGAAVTAPTVPTRLALDRRFWLAPGSYGLAIHATGCGLAYTTGGTGVDLQHATADVRITCGLAKAAPFAAGSNSPRVWNGILHYDLCSLGALSGYGWFAPGCPTSLGTVPGQTVVALPTMGQTFAVAFTGLPYNVAFALIGTSRTTSALGPLPLDLAPFGAPGCMLRVDPLLGGVTTGSNGQAVFATAVPNDPAFLCLPFFGQALAFDPTANAVGWVSSDAWAGVIGH